MNTTDFLSIANAICPDRDAVVFEEKGQYFRVLTTARLEFAEQVEESGELYFQGQVDSIQHDPVQAELDLFAVRQAVPLSQFPEGV